ncbi:MAG: NAD(P)H-dependent oxidoreductase [Hyphomonadaceae bacterium]
MKVHVVYAYPLQDGLSAHIHRTVVDSLQQAGHTVDDLDLYAEGFDPVLSAEDREIYHDTPENRRRVQPYVDRLLAAEGLVFCHPVWNFGWPAILKGYIDRVFLLDVSFKLEASRFSPGLTNLRKMATVTTYGVHRWQAFFVSDPPRANATRFLPIVSKPGTANRYIALYGINTIKPGQAERFLGRVRREMLAF